MSREIVQTQQNAIRVETNKAWQAASEALLEGASTGILGSFSNIEDGRKVDPLDPASYGDVVSAKAKQIARELDNGDKQGSIDALHQELSRMSPQEFKRLLKLTNAAEQNYKGADLEIYGLEFPNGQEPKSTEKRYSKNGGSIGDHGFAVGFHDTKIREKPIDR
jgi:hypothetical protein